MPEYAKPNTSADYRASVQECLDRAQRALEVAEVNLDTLAGKINELASGPRGVDPAIVLGHAEARTRLGQAWAELADSKVWAAEA
jgi:hypothetical protein